MKSAEAEAGAAAMAEANAAMRKGDAAGAERILRAHIADHAADADAMVMLAAIYIAARMPEEAIEQLRHALTADPGHVQAHLSMIDLSKGLGRFREALDQLHQLPVDVRSDFEILAHEADLNEKLGDHVREIELYQQLVSLQPDNASLWASLGNALKILGRTDEAVDAFRRAGAVQPTYGKAWWGLSDLKTFRFDEADIATMEEMLGAALDPQDRLHLRFALGKAYEDRGDAATAFEHYDEANRLRAASIPPEARTVTARVDHAIATFTPEFYEARAGQGFASDEPIFILGMPRSGSTLIEQILASHPQIEATRELGLIPQLYGEIKRDRSLSGSRLPKKIASLDASRVNALGQEYVQRARAFRATERPHFIDKLPTNWLRVGLIRLILPNARIIDARRHPMATGFSNFKQNYGGGGAFSYSLDSIGRYYRDYLRMMAHFDRVQPGAIHRVVNERLIEDFEGEVRKLLDYLGLPFDPACLEFHRTSRAVRTPSAEQVRRPISREGIDRWRAYEPWLGELKAALGPALGDWDKA